MKFFTLTLLVCLLIVAFVSAVPVDETVAEEVYGSEPYNPQEPSSFFKLKKIKKLLFG